MTQTTNVSRRSFLKSVAAGAGAVSTPAVLTACGSDDDNDKELTVYAFGHGIASGDPLADRVIIWTRVTPDNANGTEARVDWKVATDQAMTNIVNSGTVVTDGNRDFTVKVDVDGLTADTTYYYQFSGKNGEQTISTDVGTTRTLPTGSVDNVKLAVCSCANFPYGTFNVYKEIANSEADVVLHLGDYIYEYQDGVYPAADDVASGRQQEVGGEILTLEQYRARYSLYRRDEDLQAAHAAKPFICVWDDHELANDTYKDGAENHNDGEGEFADRQQAAIQAYHEWLPIRSGDDKAKIYRSFDFGDLLSLHMLDTRMIARDKPVDYFDYISETEGLTDQAQLALFTALKDENRTLLGDDQQQYLIGSMIRSNAKWQVLGQQVLMGRIGMPKDALLSIAAILGLNEKLAEAETEEVRNQILAQIGVAQATALGALSNLADLKQADPNNEAFDLAAPYNLDAWDGYPPAREEILRRARILGKKLVVLAGDTHNAWASELYESDDAGNVLRNAPPVGVEFATASVTSPGFETYVGFGTDTAKRDDFEEDVVTLVDDLKYVNASDRGYMLVEITPEKASSEWRFVDTVDNTVYGLQMARGKKLEARRDSMELEDVTPAVVV